MTDYRIEAVPVMVYHVHDAAEDNPAAFLRQFFARREAELFIAQQLRDEAVRAIMGGALPWQVVTDEEEC